VRCSGAYQGWLHYRKDTHTLSLLRAFLSAAALSGALLSASSADAHAKLVASTPAANASIAAPAKLQLSFDEKLVAKGSSVELFATTLSGKKLAAPMSITVRSALGADGKSMVAPIGKPLSAGTYLVAWHAVTSDGERKNGTFSFTVR